jgi:hypothetical protein
MSDDLAILPGDQASGAFDIFQFGQIFPVENIRIKAGRPFFDTKTADEKTPKVRQVGFA